MRKSLVISGMILVAACIVLLCVCRKIDSEKENIIVTEETIWGDSEAAFGITLQIASCLNDPIIWGNKRPKKLNAHVLWDTVYTIGSREGAESVFTFLPKEQGQLEVQGEKYIECILRQSYGTVYTGNTDEAVSFDETNVWFSMPEIIFDVAGRTEAGEERQEIVRIGDYYEYSYPIGGFEIRNQNTQDITSSRQGLVCEYLTDFFHIPPGEDTAEVKVEKNEEGELTYFHLYIKDAYEILSASAVGEKGGYYIYSCTDKDGNAMDRGQNKGIFYIPYTWKDDGTWIVVDWDQIRKVCEQPEGAIPVKMLLDEENERIFLVLRNEKEFQLAIYRLEGEYPILMQQFPVLAGYEGEAGKVDFPYFRQITVEEGGLLLTWQDNTFSFVAKEGEQYQLWYHGKFPIAGREEAVLSQDSDVAEKLEHFMKNNSTYVNPECRDIKQNIQGGNESFTAENACFFDGERLVLASLTTQKNTEVLLSVYHKDGLAYCGLYQLSQIDQAYTWVSQMRVIPQRLGERGCIRLQ